MQLILVLFWSSLLEWAYAQAPKAVFAHFMVGNSAQFQQSDWEREIHHAKVAGIDAFALNMAYNDSTNEAALPIAFAAAGSESFKLFFSFDYAGNGAWPKDIVASTIQRYASHPAYFHRGSQPFVSTFEGPGNMTDWPAIRRDTGCFFMPDWSSIGARPATAAGIADGLFSWDAWPKGPANMTTYPDASYYDFLKGLPYMMPVSPWFYTNMPGYDKNWLWRGDDLWFHRWQQALSLDHQPDYIQIISWNDFGESHYIGPLDDKQYVAFDIGQAPYNYVLDMPHDGWRQFLPYVISLYKTGTATVNQEGVVTWYRLNPNGACDDGGTTGNTASQLQLEYSPNKMMEDRVFYSALLTASAQVTVSINGVSRSAAWDQTPYGGVGIYHGSVAIRDATGPVIVTISRGGQNLATVNGASITRICTRNLNNYNAWVGSSTGSVTGSVSPATNLAKLNCTQGFGVYDFIGLCAFTCVNGYCPSTACVCLNKGVSKPPPSKGQAGYPLPGKSIVYSGLCNFACDHGYCPDTICGKTPNTGTIPTSSPFLPPACTGGTGAGAFEGLCNFGCNYGFCPMHACTCTRTGILIDAPPKINTKGYFLGEAKDYGLCNFACSHGYCPPVCGNSTGGNAGPGRDSGPVVTLDPAVWTLHTAVCPPPCVFVFPPTTLARPTTINFPLLSTSLEVGWSTTITTNSRVTKVFTSVIVTTTIVVPALTTSVISFSNFHLTTTLSGAVQPVVWPIASISPPPFIISATPPGVTASATPRTIRPPPWPYGMTYSSQSTSSPSSTSPTTSTLVPLIIPWQTIPPNIITIFPPETVSWVTEWIAQPTTTEVNRHPVPVIPCWAWFIWRCPPHVGGIILFGWRVPGIYPRGFPPVIGPGPLPPGLKLRRIVWPQITIGDDLIPTYPTPDPEEEICNTATAEICTTIESYGVVAKKPATKPTITQPPEPTPSSIDFLAPGKRDTTTASSTVSFCTVVTGCGASDISETEEIEDPEPEVPKPYIILPGDPKVVSDTLRVQLAFLSKDYYESQAPGLGTLFFFVPSLTLQQRDLIKSYHEIIRVYVPKGRLTKDLPDAAFEDEYGEDDYEPKPNSQTDSAQGSGGNPQGNPQPNILHNDTHVGTNGTYQKRQPIMKRAEIQEPWHANIRPEGLTMSPEMVMLSWPPGKGPVPAMSGTYNYDDSAGQGTFFYSVDTGVNPSHNELTNARIRALYPGPNPVNSFRDNHPGYHGTVCMAKAVGKNLGVARRVSEAVATVFDWETQLYETWLDALAKVYDDIRSKGRGTKSVVNMSVSIEKWRLKKLVFDRLAYVIDQILALGAVFVTGSGNTAGLPIGYPAMYADPENRNYIPSIILVGSTWPNGARDTRYCEAPWVTCYAAGSQIVVPDPGKGVGIDAYRRGGGTSFASPVVAGLAAYFRALNPDGLDTVLAVKEQIVSLAYQRQRDPGDGPKGEYQRHVVWNGQSNGQSRVGQCDRPNSRLKRQADGSCPIAFPPQASPITIQIGEAAPTCTSGLRCGSLCEGFFCEGSPLQQNPDFLDPLNPDSVQNPTGPNYGNWNGNRTITPLPTGPPTTPTPPVTPKPSQNPTTTTSPPHSVPTIARGLFVLEILWYAQPLLDLELELTGWYYMQGKVGGRSQDLCGKPFDTVTYDPGEDGIPTLPPDNDFHGWILFAEYGKCQYHARGLDPPEPGYVTCDKGGRFDCVLDEAGTIDCGGGDWRTPTMRCDFPALY